MGVGCGVGGGVGVVPGGTLGVGVGVGSTAGPLGQHARMFQQGLPEAIDHGAQPRSGRIPAQHEETVPAGHWSSAGMLLQLPEGVGDGSGVPAVGVGVDQDQVGAGVGVGGRGVAVATGVPAGRGVGVGNHWPAAGMVPSRVRARHTDVTFAR